MALGESRQFASAAFRVTVRHAHCAGAAFSGGFTYGLLHDWPMERCLTLACASGALRCERAYHEPMPADARRPEGDHRLAGLHRHASGVISCRTNLHLFRTGWSGHCHEHPHADDVL